MMPRKSPEARASLCAFSLLETVVMLVVLGVFILLLAGTTKHLWHKPAPVKALPALTPQPAPAPTPAATPSPAR
ncbi:MAG: hypothetical protein ACO1TE_05660 [Prosthecobacter sp.]